MLNQKHLSFFSKIVGRDNCKSDKLYLKGYSYDSTRQIFEPDCVIFPQNENQISQILSYCNKHLIPVVPRGAGSGMSGGSLCANGGVVLAMEKYFNQILEIDEKNLTARVQPAVINKVLQNEVEKKGLFYPPDPASQEFSTIGGNVGENAGGMRALKYGTTKDYILALRAVLPNGDVICAGKKTIKDVAGYNLVGILCGSEGTLAVITEITLKLLAKPKVTQVMIGSFGSIQDSMNAVYQTLAEGVTPVAMEFLDTLTLQALSVKMNKEIAKEAKAVLILQIDGDILESLAYQTQKIKEVFFKNKCLDFQIAKDQDKANEIWSMRRNASQSITIYGKKKLNEDITVPRGNLPKLLEGIEEIGRKYNLKIVCFGHAGDGNVHTNVMIQDSQDEEELQRGYRAVEEIFRLTIGLEGTLSGEHGIGLSKALFMQLAFSEAEMNLFKNLKKAFDPNNILNPNKMGL
ncbi:MULTISPECIES: FAD-linked oxidase C-terminal domain-containing protein [unclassified Helicobacter]|uniref:FAD-linked oxidase C-terminal domain-containing protein n=1 Tax=unclassified Helicobacter TaxID=2593540 RepID=UPI000CF0F52E|nr:MULTISPECIES: FAD-linked oxidase C-terminal domain-containing protein [unclassified Helicobacter]